MSEREANNRHLQNIDFSSHVPSVVGEPGYVTLKWKKKIQGNIVSDFSIRNWLFLIYIIHALNCSPGISFYSRMFPGLRRQRL